MKRYPHVSIIILNWNGLADTVTCLKSLRKTTYPNFEIMVVDNASKRNEAAEIKKKFGEFVSVFRLKENRGFTGGNNWAIKKAKGKYVVLLNNDTTVKPDWLNHLISAMESDEKIAVVQPKILLMRDKRYFDYAGAAGGYIDKYGYPFTRGRVFNTLEKDNGQYDDVKEIFWASGAAMLIRRIVIKKVGGFFDEKLFNYMEEIDFCWRIWRKGYKVLLIPTSVVYHKVASTAKRNIFLKRFWEHRNNLLILTRNLPRREFLGVLVLRAFFEIFTYFYYLLSGQIRFIGSLFLAHLDYLRLLYGTRLFRFRIKTENLPPIYERSIGVDYFLMGKRYFWELDWRKAGGERIDPNVSYLKPITLRYKKTYSFCVPYLINKTILDAGCGDGFGSYLISQKTKKVIAIDSDEKTIRLASRRYKRENLKYLTQDILALNGKEKFDVVLSLQVIEHMPNPMLYLEKISGVLKADGLAIFSTPNKTISSYNENPYHYREYTPTELRRVLQKYFVGVKVYGLHGDRVVMRYERERKKKIMQVFALDKFKLRRHLPRRVKILLFEFFIPIVRKALLKKIPQVGFSLTQENFYINRNTRGAIDLIAICKGS